MDYLEACHFAQELVKKAGFELTTVSGKSEACYYSHPARAPLLLRIGTHSSKRSPVGLSNVVSRVTFSPRDPTGMKGFSEYQIHNQMAMAIGRYFLNEPKPSEYYGRKGMWKVAAPVPPQDSGNRT